MGACHPTFLQYCSRTSARILARRPRPYGPRQRRGHREGTTLVEVSSWRRDGRPVQLSLRLFELRATFLYGLTPVPTGNGICPLPQKMGAVRAGSHLRILTVIHSVTCGSLLSLDVSGVRGWHDWQVESRVGSSPLHRAEVLVAPEHKPDDSTPARLNGGRVIKFLAIYLRKLNTLVLRYGSLRCRQ